MSTLAGVAADAGPIADASLRGQGFTCTDADAVLLRAHRRRRPQRAHVRGGLWLSSVETAWHPEDYGLRASLRTSGLIRSGPGCASGQPKTLATIAAV